MKFFKLDSLAFSLLTGIAAIPVSQLPTQAIVINNAAGSATARALGAQFTAVVEIDISDQGFCTGALINSRHVLTAQHCTSIFNAEDFIVRFRDRDLTNTLLGEIPVISKFELDPMFDPLGRVSGNDIAILELSSAAPESITPLRFLADNPTSIVATTVGFGLNGLGSNGHEFSRDGLRWAAENTIDFYGNAIYEEGIIPDTYNLFSTDFDDGSLTNNTLAEIGSSPLPLANEGTTAPGDSGSPLLVSFGDEFLIAGVLSDGSTPTSAYGDISLWAGTNQHRSFIERFGGNYASVPEPSIMLGLFWLGAFNLGIKYQQKNCNAEE